MTRESRSVSREGIGEANSSPVAGDSRMSWKRMIPTPGGIHVEMKKLGGNADGCENKGVAKKRIQKMLKTKD